VKRARQTLPAIAGGPLCMILGAVVGGAGANALATNEPLLVGCTSFGGGGPAQAVVG
jgi:hypothetical protein